jgi:nitrite reductase/ring-hydroxylating ferredoxin subunit/uncharacterized membrane protein
MVRQSLGVLTRMLLLGRRAPADPADSAGLAHRPARKTPFARLAALAERAERAPSLDGPVQVLSDVVVRALPPATRLDDTLHGVPFGQPAHPALVRLPLGCWTSAVLLDFLPGAGHFSVDAHFPARQRSHASQVLLAVGLAAAVPSAATGLADWSALHTDQQRVGLVHAIAQAGATLLFAGSLLARRAGRRGGGTVLAACGLATATVGGYLGGHLAMRLGAGSSHAEPVGHLAAIGWQDLCPLAELPDGRPARRQLGYLSLLAVRAGADVYVLSDQCSHLGGPLHQGRQVTDRGAACVVCPWHGSTFRLSDGAVRRGPATATQPAFEARVTDAGTVQVRPLSTPTAARAGKSPRPFRSAAG